MQLRCVSLGKVETRPATMYAGENCCPMSTLFCKVLQELSAKFKFISLHNKAQNGHFNIQNPKNSAEVPPPQTPPPVERG